MTTQRYTAAQQILLAADDLATAGAAEFSEWQLSLAAWERDKKLFGMRGMETAHPDHKRAYMEFTGQKRSNPLKLGLLARVRPSVFKLTPLGRAEAARLRQCGGSRGGCTRPMANLFLEYDTVHPYVASPVFAGWRDDPDTPREFAAVLEFLRLRLGSGEKINRPLIRRKRDQARAAAQAAMDWCNRHNVDRLTKGPKSADVPIYYRTLAELLDFLTALEYRFVVLSRAAS